MNNIVAVIRLRRTADSSQLVFEGKDWRVVCIDKTTKNNSSYSLSITITNIPDCKRLRRLRLLDEETFNCLPSTAFKKNLNEEYLRHFIERWAFYREVGEILESCEVTQKNCKKRNTISALSILISWSSYGGAVKSALQRGH